MAAPAVRLLLSDSKVSACLIRGSSLSRSALGSIKDHELLPPPPPSPSRFLSHPHFQEPTNVDLQALLGTRKSISPLRAGMGRPVVDKETVRSYSRGRRVAEESDDDSEEVSGEEFGDGMEDFDSDDDDGHYDDEELMQEHRMKRMRSRSGGSGAWDHSRSSLMHPGQT